MIKTSYSQIGQDKEIVHFFGGKKEGYFVEIGAYDGKTLSNTLALERELKWNGICVEPLPQRFKQVLENRNPELCTSFNYALDSIGNQTVKFSCFEMESGIKERIDKYQFVVEQGTEIEVQTQTLNWILEQAKAPRVIDYLSLDVEGNELEVLKGCDLNKWIFRYITVEHNWVEPKRTQIREYLESYGYIHRRENQFDDDYVYFKSSSPSQTLKN